MQYIETIMQPETSGIEMVLSLMALSARTAPKGKGVDEIALEALTGKNLKTLSREMERIGTEREIGFFLRDAGNIAACDACLIIGVRGAVPAGVYCGGCGFATCDAMADAFGNIPVRGHFTGPNCVIRMADIGIAVGSAAKTASLHNADNRIMYSAGVAALSLGMCPGCTVAYGIPLKAGGKNIFFDRSR